MTGASHKKLLFGALVSILLHSFLSFTYASTYESGPLNTKTSPSENLKKTALSSTYYSSIDRINAKNGMPETTIYSMAADNDGFIWLGTPTSLLRYDGYQFRTYSKQNGKTDHLNTSSAGNIFIDSKRRLWIGSWGEGLSVYDMNINLIHQFIHIPFSNDSIPNNRVQTIYEDKSGNIWIGTNGGGLALFNESTTSFTRYQHDPNIKNSLSHNRVWSITEDINGSIWVATSNGLNKLDIRTSSFDIFLENEYQRGSLSFSLVRSLLSDSKGRLWVGTQNGFGEFDINTNKFRHIELTNHNGTAIISRIREDNNGNIYIGTLDGLYLYKPKDNQFSLWKKTGKYQLLAQNDIRDIMFDHAGLLWIATRYNGLIKIDMMPARFEHIDSYTSGALTKTFKRANTIFSDSKQFIWIGTSNGLIRYDQRIDSTTKIQINGKEWSANISAIDEDSEGNLWIGTYSGLYFLDNSHTKLTLRNDIIKGGTSNIIDELIVDSHDNIWVSLTHQGVILYGSSGQRSWYQFDEKDSTSLNGNNITKLYEDSNGRIWIGTNTGGVSRYDSLTKSFLNINKKGNPKFRLSDDIITEIYQTQDSKIWFGTPRGLDKLDIATGEIKHYNIKSGLVDNNIKSIIEDGFGELWVNTTRGISQYKSSEDIFTSYSGRDIFNSNSFYPSNVALGINNTLFFGGSEGVSKIILANMKRSTYTPKTLITKLLVDDKSININDDNDVLKLPHDTKRIEIEFVTLDYLEPDKNLYSYKLGGLIDKWHSPSKSQLATFTNLDPGLYQFSVKGGNSYNVWSTDYPTITIRIMPPWWNILWVQILLALCFFIFIHLWIRWKVKTYELQKQQLKLAVKSRTKELNQSNKSLNISNHELEHTIEKLEHSKLELVKKEKMASLGQMVAGVGHEINTPIGTCITASSALQDRMQNLKNNVDKQKVTKKNMQDFLCEGNELTSLINGNLNRVCDLIDKFKQVANKTENEIKKTFNFATFLGEVKNSFKSKQWDKEYQIIIDCHESIIISSYPDALKQVILNLLSNSVIHGFKKADAGVISIKVFQNDDTYIINYKDNGVGISTEYQKVMFEPFETTRRGAGSSGLGMLLVYNLITQVIRGNIQIDETVPKGVSFNISIPS